MDQGSIDLRPSWSGMEVFAATVPKSSAYPNEDVFAYSSDMRILALADGASVSYDPRTFAVKICEKFLENQNVNKDWIQSLASEVSSSYDHSGLPWMKLAALERGSFSSLLGIEVLPEQELIKITAVGDSNCVVLADGEAICHFPLDTPSQFDRSPNLISTNQQENIYLDDVRLSEAQKLIDISEADMVIVVAASDALAKWIIENENHGSLELVCSIKEQAEFVQFVEESRKAGVLKLDDTTLVVMRAARELSAEY